MLSKSAKQCEQMLSKSTHTLILLPQNPEHDFFCAAVALAHFCAGKNITTTIGFFDPYEKTNTLSFLTLPKECTITHTVAGTRDLILSFNTTYNDILDVRTEKTDDAFTIHITPERGMIDSRDFSFTPGTFPYDTIVTIGATDKEAMGKMYDEIPDIFYELPIINIDNKSGNEQFGQMNIVHTIASSISEMIGDFFTHITHTPTKHEAQALLTGIIGATNSFQNHHTTPHALTLASILLDNGADQQMIIRNLYRNQTFSFLQLWGGAMKNLSTSSLHDAIVRTTLTHDVLERTKAHTHHIHAILPKMMENYPKGKIFIVLYEEKPSQFCALINTKKANLIFDDDHTNIHNITDHLYRCTLTAKNAKNAEKEMDEMLLRYVAHLKSKN